MEEEKCDPYSATSHMGHANTYLFVRGVLSYQMQWKDLCVSQSRDGVLPSPARLGLQQCP